VSQEEQRVISALDSLCSRADTSWDMLNWDIVQGLYSKYPEFLPTNQKELKLDQEEILKWFEDLIVPKNKFVILVLKDFNKFFGAPNYRGQVEQKILRHIKNLSQHFTTENKSIIILSNSYDLPNDLEKIWDFWKPEIVQVPFNILDQRIQNTGWISKLKKFGILVFARSCFLQGLLLSNFRSNKNFKKFNTILDHFSIWCKAKGISRLQACIDFVKLNKNIDYLVIGFNNYTQFDEILKSFNNKKIVKIPNIFGTNKLDLIDPRRWR
jgi:hypothetical protein